MQCLTLKILSLHTDKELPAGRANKVQEHLNECPDCRKASEELCVLNKKLAGAFEYQALPLGFEQRFYEKLEGAQTKMQIFIPRLAWAGSAIAAVLLLVITFYGSFSGKHPVSTNLNIASIQKKITTTVSGSNLIKNEQPLASRTEQKLIDDIANDVLKYL